MFACQGARAETRECDSDGPNTVFQQWKDYSGGSQSVAIPARPPRHPPRSTSGSTAKAAAMRTTARPSRGGFSVIELIVYVGFASFVGVMVSKYMVLRRG